VYKNKTAEAVLHIQGVFGILEHLLLKNFGIFNS
jgi:hypothetical protein